MDISNALNNKPVKVMGFLTGAHSLAYGIGYLTAKGGFSTALVGANLGSEFLSMAIGVSLVVVGSILMFAFARANPKTIDRVSAAQSLVWLFITFLYLARGDYLLAFAVGLFWTILSGYIAFASKNRVNIMAYDRTSRAMLDTAEEDTL